MLSPIGLWSSFVWAFVAIQSLLQVSLTLKLALNAGVFVAVLFRATLVGLVLDRRYVWLNALYVGFFVIHGADNLGRVVNNLFFIGLIYLAYLGDPDPVRSFRRGFLVFGFLLFGVYLTNYHDVRNAYYVLGDRFLVNNNGLGIFFSAGFPLLLGRGLSSRHTIGILAVAVLVLSTRSNGAMLASLATIVFAYSMHRGRIPTRRLAQLFVAGYAALAILVVFLFLSGGDWYSTVEVSGLTALVTSKVYLLSDLFPEIMSGDRLDWLLGIDYEKIPMAGSDFEYTLVVFEVMYKYGIVGLLLFFGGVYWALRRLIETQREEVALIFVWGLSNFLFGAGLNSPNPQMTAFWFGLFAAFSHRVESRDQVGLHPYRRMPLTGGAPPPSRARRK